MEEEPARGARSEGGRRSVEGAHGNEEGVGQSQLRRQVRPREVRQPWSHIDEINRLTAEKLELFEVETFDRHLQGCLFGKDFDSWTDLSESCGLTMEHANMAILCDIAASNPRAVVLSLVQGGNERAGGPSGGCGKGRAGSRG